MLSQPATKIFLRTNEAHAARWISETIGEVEIEQLRESHASEQFPRDHRSKSFQLERRVEPLVMASEISGTAQPVWLPEIRESGGTAQLSLPQTAQDTTGLDRTEYRLAVED